MLLETLNSVETILKGDQTITRADRREFLRLLAHGPDYHRRGTNGERLIRRQAAAARLGVSLRQVDNLAQRGVLKRIIFPGRRRGAGILESSLSAALQH